MSRCRHGTKRIIVKPLMVDGVLSLLRSLNQVYKYLVPSKLCDLTEKNIVQQEIAAFITQLSAATDPSNSVIMNSQSLFALKTLRTLGAIFQDSVPGLIPHLSLRARPGFSGALLLRSLFVCFVFIWKQVNRQRYHTHCIILYLRQRCGLKTRTT